MLNKHVVNTVEVETPKIIKEAVRGKKSVIREKLNQVMEHIKNPQIPYTNKVVDLMKDVLVVMQQQMPVQKTAETSQLQFPNKVDEMPVAVQRQIPWSRLFRRPWRFHSCSVLTRWLMTLLCRFHREAVEKTVGGPQLQIVEQIVETPETQTIQGARTSERSGTAPVCQVTQAEIAEVIEIGASIPAESASPIFVTAPVLENYPVVVGSVQTAHVAEYMGPAHTVTCAHAAPVVECATAAPAIVNAAPMVTYGASPVTYATRQASFQLPQEIVYEKLAPVYEASGSRPVEYVQPLAPLTCAAPAVTHATRPLPVTTMAVAHREVGEKPADDMVSKMRDLKNDLVHIRELLGILVRKERSAETKAEIAARRLDKMEREQHEDDDAEQGLSESVEGREGARRQMVRRQRLWLRESPCRRNRVHPRQRRARY